MSVLSELSYVIEHGRLPIREDMRTKMNDAIKQLYKLGITGILASMGVSDIEDFILSVDENTFNKAKSNLNKIGMVESKVIEEGFLDFFKGQNRNVLIMTAIMALSGLTGDAHAGWGFEDFKNAAGNVAAQTQKVLTSPEAQALGKASLDVAKGTAKGAYDAATSKEAKALGKASFDAATGTVKGVVKGAYDAVTSKEAQALGKATVGAAVGTAKGAYDAATSSETKALGKAVGDVAVSGGKIAIDRASKLPEKIEAIKYDMDQRDLKKRAEREKVANDVIYFLDMPKDSLNNAVEMDSTAFREHIRKVMSDHLQNFTRDLVTSMKDQSAAERERRGRHAGRRD